ncbi:hypothetical protein Hanom_Chr14g01263141 [Helianthus anomalus]
MVVADGGAVGATPTPETPGGGGGYGCLSFGSDLEQVWFSSGTGNGRHHQMLLVQFWLIWFGHSQLESTRLNRVNSVKPESTRSNTSQLGSTGVEQVNASQTSSRVSFEYVV